MDISLDDLGDWVCKAADLEQLIKEIGEALLTENILEAGELTECARPVASALVQRIRRAGGKLPEAYVTEMQRYPTYTYELMDRNYPEAQRAAQALERAALLVIALEQELDVTAGMGATLAEFAAELNLLAFRNDQDQE